MGVYIKVFKKDVNKALLLLVLVPLILFVWFSNYYYTSLKNITVEYNNTKATGNAVQSDFLKDKEVLEKSYNDLRNENELLIKENERLKSDLEKKSANFNVIQERYVEMQDILIEANDDLSRLSAKNKELCQKLKEKGGEC